MSLWGNLKSAEIPDDPFSIPANTYFCMCTEAGEAEHEGQRQFRVKFVVMDRGSAYYESPISHKYDLPDPEKEWSDLTVKEQWGPKFLKQHMAKGFDMTPEEIDDPIPSEHMIGKYMYVTTTINSGSGKNASRRYTNVNDVVCQRIMDIENEDFNETAKSMDL